MIKLENVVPASLEQMEFIIQGMRNPIRKKIGDIVGGNFYVLPSSIHEVMIIPEEGFEAGELSKLVSTCNSQLYTEANSKDILSDKVQWCSMDGEILRRAENE